MKTALIGGRIKAVSNDQKKLKRLLGILGEDNWVFSENARETLDKSKASKIFVTDTIEVSENKKFKKLEILSVSEEIAREIKNSS